MKRKLSNTGIVVCILIICLYYLYDSFKPGYVFENGTWNYVSYDAAVGRRVTPINVKKDEFYVLKNIHFARDNTSVYFKSEKVEGADPDTFQVISDRGRFHYAKDKNSVYIYVRDDWSLYKVINADPNSFEVLEFPYSKDKNDAYCGNLPLFVDDVSKFEVIEGARSATMSSVDSFLGTGPDSKNVHSESLRSNNEYNSEKYGFITKWVFYSEDGKAKTDKLTYNGYRLVEGSKTAE